MAYQLKYDSKLKGNNAVAARNGAQVRVGLTSYGTAYNYNQGTSAGTCTGYYYTDGDVVYAQMTNGGYAVVENIYSPEWDFMATNAAIMQYSQPQAQALVNTIIKNNQKIICNNLLCARFANKLTGKQRQQVRELQERLQVRNNALQAEGLCDGVQTSHPAGYAELSAYMDKLMSDGGIGVATWVVVVIAATVIAATATAAYYAYKALADESERDVKFSDDLTRTLTSKLTEEEYQQLLNETKGIVTKSKIKQSLRNYSGIITAVALGVGSAMLYKWLKNRL